MTLDVLFFILIAYLISFILSSLYTLPLEYYLVASVAFSLLGLKIAFLKSHVDQKYPLLQVFLLASIIIATPHLVNPFFIGADSYVSYHWEKLIKAAGHIVPELAVFYDYPASYILNSMIGLIMADMPLLPRLLPVLGGVLTVLLVYLIARSFLGVRAALFASLLASISPPLLLTCCGYGAFLTLPVLLLSAYNFFVVGRASAGFWVVLWLPAMALFFTHPVPAAALIMAMAATRLTLYITPILGNRGKAHPYSAFLSYGIAFIAYLFYVSDWLFTRVVRTLLTPVEKSIYISISMPPGLTPPLFGLQVFLGYLGVASLGCFAAFIGLRWLINREDTAKIVALMIPVLIAMFCVSTLLAGKDALEPERMIRFIAPFLLLPASAGFVRMARSLHTRRTAYILVVVLLLPLSFFSVTSYHTGINALPELVTDIPLQRRHVTLSEVRSHSYLLLMNPNSIRYLDPSIGGYVLSWRGVFGRSPYQNTNVSSSSTELEYYIVSRSTLERGFHPLERSLVYEAASNPGFCRLFSDSNVEIYARRA